MIVKKVIVGPLDTNCYILSENGSAIVVDPGEDADLILKELSGLVLEKIILTHLHFDHIIAASKIKRETGAPIYCHKNDLGILDEKLLKESDIDEFIDENSDLKIENWKLKIVFIPGHTPGSICLLLSKGVSKGGSTSLENPILFSGDTVFKGNIGATHFKGGDFSQIKESITEKILTLPDDTIVYPGHGEKFRLGDYKEEIREILS